MGFSLKQKNLVLEEQSKFFLQLTPFEKGGKNTSGIVASLEIIHKCFFNALLKPAEHLLTIQDTIIKSKSLEIPYNFTNIYNICLRNNNKHI